MGGGVGLVCVLNTISAVLCCPHSRWKHSTPITLFFVVVFFFFRTWLERISVSAFLLPVHSFPSQAERMINYAKLLHAD